jgi:hypothetical protein
VCPGPLRQLGANACALGLWVVGDWRCAQSLFVCGVRGARSARES